MKHRNLLLSLLILFITVPAVESYSQETADSLKIWLIDTRDGNSFIGNILTEDNNQIVLQTDAYGKIIIPKTQVKKRKELFQEDLVEGEYWFENPHVTRYYFMTSGYGLDKGEGYYQNTWVLFNQVSYGFTNNLSLGVSVLPLFLFAGSPTPVWITPKIALPIVKDKINLGAGMLLGYVLGEDFGFGLGYGALTLGGRDKNVSLGAGWAYADSQWADKPTFSLSGMFRVGKKGYLITENYYIGTADISVGIISLGGRSVQRKLAIDYGLIIPLGTDMDTFFALPWLGIAVPFGNTK
jgi:hypothetical protein